MKMLITRKATSTTLLLVLAVVSLRPCWCLASSGNAPPETLVFKVDCTVRSEPVGCGGASQEEQAALVDFFQRQSTLALLVSAGGARKCTQIPMTPHIQNLWKEACDQYYGADAFDNDDAGQNHKAPVVMATNVDTKFPGFRYATTVLNYCKRLPAAPENDGMPCYEFYLIGEKKELTGSPPVVWLVRKLIGLPPPQPSEKTSGETADFVAPATCAKSRVSITEVQQDHNQGSNKEYAFQMDLEFRTMVQFPKMLLKLLPASKEKVEERGTESVRKLVTKDGHAALSAVCNEWLKLQRSDVSPKADAFDDRNHQPEDAAAAPSTMIRGGGGSGDVFRKWLRPSQPGGGSGQ